LPKLVGLLAKGIFMYRQLPKKKRQMGTQVLFTHHGQNKVGVKALMSHLLFYWFWGMEMIYFNQFLINTFLDCVFLLL
jgi:hypothetical protein